MKFLNNIDLLQSQLQNAVIHLIPNLDTNPPSGELGQVAYDNTKNILYIYTDDGWTVIPTIKTLNAEPGTGNIEGELFYDTVNNLLKVFDAIEGWIPVGKLYNISAVTDSGVKIRLTDSVGITDDILLSSTDGTIVITNPNDSTIDLAHYDTNAATSLVYDIITKGKLVSDITLDSLGHITALDTKIADLQFVTEAGSTTDQAISITNTTEANDLGEGALVVSGGASVGGNLFVGGDLHVQGDLTYVESNEVNIGDSNILLNADITDSADNANGGISVKRIDTVDGVTDRSVQLEYDVVSDRWNQTFGPADEEVRSSVLPVKLSYALDSSLPEVSLSGTEYTVTHNLNTKDLSVVLREVGTDYEVVYTDIEYPTTNTVLLRFAVAPTEGAYRVILIG